MLWLWLLALVRAGCATVTVGADGAFEDCRCIDHLDTGGNLSSWARLLAGHVLGATLQPLGNLRPVPRNYGSSRCQAWDAHGAGVAECDELGAPSYCERSWCFVDPDDCEERRRPVASAMFEGLFYSYTACGNVDNFLIHPPLPIIVHSFGEELAPVLQSRTPAWRAVAMFTYQVLAKLQVPRHKVVYRPLSNASLAEFGSEYTACVHDLALGHLDLCVGDFWDTPQRRSFQAGFTTTVYSEYIYLYATRRTVELTFWELLYQPIKPFTFGLWALILGVMVASGVALALFEFQKPGGDFEASSGILGALLYSTYLSFVSFVNAGLSYNPQTTSGRIFATGLGLFICIAIASFTANTASFLIYEAQTVDVRDLDDALAKGMKVCSFVALQEVVLLSFPPLEQLGVFVFEFEDLLAALDRGDCEVALVPEPSIINAHAVGDLCHLESVGRPVLAFPTGMYVSDRLQHHFNWAAADKRADGTWASLEARLYPSSTCDSQRRPGTGQGPAQLQAHHMYGNCFLLLLCFCLSMAVHLCAKVEKTEIVQRVEHETITHIHSLEHTLHDLEHHAFCHHQGAERPAQEAAAQAADGAVSAREVAV